jgi:hypothetical protein
LGSAAFPSRDSGSLQDRPSLVVYSESPILSVIPNQTTPANTVLGPVGFTVTDAESNAGLVTVSAVSSNPGLIPNGNLVLEGAGSLRAIRLAPLAGQTGVALITLVATDPDGATARSAFLLTVTPVANPDSDGDGMDDAFELVHGLNPFSALDGLTDPDGDGAINAREYQAGTDPGSELSVFRITLLEWREGKVHVGFRSIPGRAYRIERLLDPVLGSWIPVVERVVASGAFQAHEDLEATPGSGAMYRVRLVP